jgi:ABC-type metal ion transport system substrate-binding protein
MTISKALLLKLIEEQGLIPMSDEELEIALPTIHSIADNMKEISEMDLSGVRTSHVFRASV